ncbi:MAG: relaxase/mobilization nuclease domain-containing protein [Butyrivibrio sp.]|nr:relaxase/mobilization nuclease domain-containing protein [Butyrivibrio sp.]
MTKGIVAKIWNIKDGSKGRGAGAQISDSIDYITNSEKCDETLGNSQAQIGRELSYVTNDVKTLEGLYVGCRHISDIKNATNEMMQVKEFHGKLGGRVALHGIISLDAAESDKKNAGKLMMLLNDLLEEIFPNNQAVYAVHTNTENLHIHFILNTVGLNGAKIHMDKSFMSKVFEPALNRLAEKYGFTPNEAWVKGKEENKVSFGEIMVKLRQAVDEAIERSESFDDFLKDLRGQGLSVNCGKYLSLKADGMTKAVRSYRLGSMYTVEMIRDRILKKREELIRSEVGEHTGRTKEAASVFVKTSPLKKYRDMTDDEKQKCIKALKLGRNPWRERQESNWQIQRLSDEFKRTANVYELIRTYAPRSGNAQDALDNIVDRQKELAKEKKAVRENLKTYQPIIRLYKEIKKHARKAYLYEFARCDEYLSSYMEYKNLCERLEKGYGKTVLEVSAYIEDQENQILYATAQSKELSDEYKTILRFKENELKQSVSEYMSLYDAIGFSKARSRAMQANVFESSIRYIAADGADGGYVRVVITPDVIDGKRTEKAVVTVFDETGKEVSEISSKDMSTKEFNRSISELKAEYGFYKCHTFDSREEAEDFAAKQREEKVKKVRRQTSD